MDINAKNLVEGLARMSDEERQKTANLLVTKWYNLSQDIFQKLEVEMREAFLNNVKVEENQ
tara:strand:+ start:308 stop:490 length:183 start_codon:yes stop_codon:yes gene_type:complete